MNFEKEIEGYKQIVNITAYINDDTFVCIKYFSSKTNKDKGLSYGLLVNYPFNLFEDEEEKSKRLSACRKSYSWNDADRVWNVRAADRAKRGKRTE